MVDEAWQCHRRNDDWGPAVGVDDGGNDQNQGQHDNEGDDEGDE